MKSLSHIHSKKLAHRDIKPDNLFISVDGCVKLGDFGVSATIIDKSEKNKNLKYLTHLLNLFLSGNDFNDEHPSNIELISSTLFVFNLEIKGKEFNDEHPEKIHSIFVTLIVFH